VLPSRRSQKNALEISALQENAKPEATKTVRQAVMGRAADANLRVRLEAIIAMSKIGSMNRRSRR